MADDGAGNHVYQGQATADSEAASDPPESPTMAYATDYGLQLRLRVVKAGLMENDLPDVWLTFRADLEGNVDCAYYTLAFSTRTSEITLASAAGCGYNVLARPYALAIGRWYAVDVAAIGSELTVTIDGEPIIQVTDSTSSRGTYYLNIDQDAIVQFDDIRVLDLK